MKNKSQKKLSVIAALIAISHQGLSEVDYAFTAMTSNTVTTEPVDITNAVP